MPEKHIAYCGLNCRECQVYLATVQDDDIAREKLAQEWTPGAMQHWAKVPLKPRDMNCQGCKAENSAVFAGVLTCPMRKCCSGKQLADCGQCSELETCQRMISFLQECPQAKANLSH